MSDQEPMQTNFCAEKRFSSSYDALNTMRRNSQFCDVTFVVGEKKIAAHKVILASHSNYFDKMFTGNFKDTNLLELKNVEITPNSLELLLDFLYTSQLTINDSNVQDLLMASNFLLLNDVKKECLNYIEQTIDIENYMTIKCIADKNKIKELHELFLSYILKNYNNIVKSNTFLTFSFELMMELLQSDDLCAEEEKVYESTMTWLKYDLKERLKYLPELIKSIRLSLMSVDYLDNTVQEEELIQSDSTCMRYLLHAYKIHRHIKTVDNESVFTCNSTRRKFNQKSQSNNLGIEDFKDNISSHKNFKIFIDSPKFMSLKFEQMLELIKSDDLCAEELQIYEATISWVKYDIKNRSELFPKLFLSIRLSLMQLDDLIGVIANEDLVKSNSICKDFLLNTYYEAFTLDKNILMTTSKCHGFNIFNYRNHNLKQILILYEKSGYSKIEWFDRIDNASYECSLTWPSDFTTSNLILRDGRIFSISYGDGINSVKLYDGHLNVWKTISTPVYVHKFSSVIQFKDRVYVMSTRGVEYYDILSETWQEVKFKIKEAENLKLAVVSDLIYGVINIHYYEPTTDHNLAVQCVRTAVKRKAKEVCITKAFYYNPKTDFGQIICPFTTDIDIHQVYSIFSFNNQLCVIGGNNSNNNNNIIFEKYNSKTNTWIRISCKTNQSKRPGVIELNKKLYLMGGDDCNYIQLYNPSFKHFRAVNGLYLKSSIHSNTQAFVIDTKSINLKNILKYYSNNEI